MLDPTLVPESLQLPVWITLTALAAAATTRVTIAWITKRIERQGEHESAVVQTNAFAVATLQSSIKDLEGKLQRISAANDRLEKRSEEASQEALRQELRATRAEHSVSSLTTELEDLQRRFALTASEHEREIAHLREDLERRDSLIEELRQGFGIHIPR